MMIRLPHQQWCLSLLLLLSLSGCPATSNRPAANDQPRVVATSTIIADLVEAVADDQVELTSILQPGADPHVYEPVPADSRALEQADLIFYNGYNLEPGLINLMNAAGVRAERVALGEVVTPLQLQKGSTSTVPDPHVWGDVQNAIQMVQEIRTQLTELSPEDQAVFQQNADQLMAELTQLDRWIQTQIATIPESQRQLVTTHDAFQYYSQAYGLKIIGTLIGISTEEQPSAQTTRQLVDAIRAAGVPAIFAETTINPTLIRTVAAEARVKLSEQPLYSDSVGPAGTEAATYIGMMVVNTRAIVSALGGQPTPFVPAR